MYIQSKYHNNTAFHNLASIKAPDFLLVFCLLLAPPCKKKTPLSPLIVQLSLNFVYLLYVFPFFELSCCFILGNNTGMPEKYAKLFWVEISHMLACRGFSHGKLSA